MNEERKKFGQRMVALALSGALAMGTVAGCQSDNNHSISSLPTEELEQTVWEKLGFTSPEDVQEYRQIENDLQNPSLTQEQLQDLRDRIVKLMGAVVKNKIADAEYRNNLERYERIGKGFSEEQMRDFKEGVDKRSTDLIWICTYSDSDRIDIELVEEPVDNPTTKHGQIIHSDARYTNVVFPFSVDPLMDSELYEFLHRWDNLSNAKTPTREELLTGISDLSYLATHNIKIQNPNLFNGFHGITFEDNSELTKQIDALISSTDENYR